MKLVYFNNAATSWPKPSVVAAAMADCVGHIPCQDARSGLEGENVSETCRERLAALLHIREAKQIVLGANATHALNVALHSFPWRNGASVVTTASEHNSVLRPLYQLAKTKGLRVHIIPVDIEGRVEPEVWRAALKKVQPSLAVFSHASNVTGAVNKSFGIVCRTGLHCAPHIHAFLGTAPCGTVRFSFSRFTQAQEIDYCLHAVHALLT